MGAAEWNAFPDNEANSQRDAETKEGQNHSDF